MTNNNQAAKSPLVSVLIPCYNVETYAEEAIQSILNQTYKNLEIIIINDCSTDNTSSILYNLAKTDQRIKVFENESNLKLIDTLNKGITLCNGEYIARMDADDISLPKRIEKEVEFLEKNKDHDIVSTQFYTFRNSSNKKNLYTNPVKYEQLQSYLLFKSGICHPASMFRKRVFSELGLKFEKEYLHVEDYALWSKALYATKLGNIEGEPLLLYRVHKTQVSTMYEDLQLENKKKVFKIHCKHLGIEDSEKMLDIYSSVAEANPSQHSKEYLIKCERFMTSLIEKNKVTPFCSMDFLQNMLALHWIRLCANSQIGLGVIGLCKRSVLFQQEYYSFRDKIILYTKCLFKLKYKKSMIYKIVFR
ncbi:glycosyltransferase family 2 protein [Dysgonomonas sp. 216]|nr:glycosyltransferase family 2 protein [Dysgonomonas sp. 216]